MSACRMLGKTEGAGISDGNFGPGSDQTGPLLVAEASGPFHVLIRKKQVKNRLTMTSRGKKTLIKTVLV